MKQIIVIQLVLIVLANAIDLQSYSFQSYEYEHGKFYTEGERFMRQMIFENNLRDIIQHNSNPHRSYDKGINQFTDRTPAELQVMNGYRKDMAKLHRSLSDAKIYQNKGIKLPTSFDWRNSNPSVLTSVKDQGRCGSCWTFASTAVVESHWAIKTGQLWTLSEQQVASCTKNDLNCGGTGGCSGGISQLAFQSISDVGGLASEWTYPYISYQGKDYNCAITANTPGIAKLSGYTQIQSNSYEDLMEALVTQGPISISVDASTWHSYSSGVFDGCNTMNPDVNHVVVLVGYGVDPQYGPYWTVRNSWGPKYGENGYIRVRRTGGGLYCGVDVTPQDGSGCDDGPDTVYVCGMCGVLFDNSFPNIAA